MFICFIQVWVDKIPSALVRMLQPDLHADFHISVFCFSSKTFLLAMKELLFSQMHQKGLWVNNDFHTFEASNMTSPDSHFLHHL